MAIVLDKVIIRDAGNTINTSTNYSELNVKAEGLIDDLVANIEGNAATQEAYINSNVDTMTTQIASLIDPTGTGYTTEYSDATTKTQNESNFTASGSINAKKDDLVFTTAVGNEYKLADTGRFVNLDGNVLNFPTGTEVDLTNYIP